MGDKTAQKKCRFKIRELPCDSILEPVEPVKTKHRKRNEVVSPTLAHSQTYFGTSNWVPQNRNTSVIRDFEEGDTVFAVDRFSGRDMICIIETVGERDFNGVKYPNYTVRAAVDGRVWVANSVRRVNPR